MEVTWASKTRTLTFPKTNSNEFEDALVTYIKKHMMLESFKITMTRKGKPVEEFVARVMSMEVGNKGVNLTLSTAGMSAVGVTAKRALDYFKTLKSGDYFMKSIYVIPSKTQKNVPYHINTRNAVLKKSKNEGMAKLEFQLEKSRVMTYDPETKILGSMSPKSYINQLLNSDELRNTDAEKGLNCLITKDNIPANMYTVSRIQQKDDDYVIRVKMSKDEWNKMSNVAEIDNNLEFVTASFTRHCVTRRRQDELWVSNLFACNFGGLPCWDILSFHLLFQIC